MGVISDKNNMIKFWLNVSRHLALPQTIIPYIFAVVLAAKHYHINYFLGILGLVGVILAHLGVNILDDYFDWKKGAVETRKKMIDGGMRARSHKCFYLEENMTTLNQILIVALGMCAVAGLIGLYITYKVGLPILVIAGLTAFLGFFYSAPPFRLSYNVLGELVVGVIFGPLLMCGAYLTAGGHLDKLILLVSIINGFLVSNIVYTHAIMDFIPDKEAGRVTLAVWFGNTEKAKVFQDFLMFGAYVLLLIGIILKILPLLSLIVFVTLPKAITLHNRMRNEDNTRKLWMGSMENWDFYVKEGVDWFMLRWYLSRNLVTDFVILLGVSYMLG